MTSRILMMPDAGGGVGQQGTPQANWRDSIPAEFKDSPVLRDVPDVPTLIKNYVNAERLIGNKRIALPGANAQPQEWDEVWNAIGRPVSADKYSEPTVKPTAGVQVSTDELIQARATFHKLGLTDTQARGIMDFYFTGLNGAFGKTMEGMRTAQTQAQEALRRDWGNHYDTNLDIAKSALRHYADQQAIQELESGLGNNVGLIKMMHKIGLKAMEAQARGADQGKFIVGGEAAAKQQISELMVDEEFLKAFNSATHPGHKASVERHLDLYRKAYPGTVEPT